MSVDVIQLYGPGMSFYLSKARSPSASAIVESSPLKNYSTVLDTLTTTNKNLEYKMAKLRSSALQLKLDLMQLHRHIAAYHHDLLATWQADTLTRLIEVLHDRQCRKLPGGHDIGDHEVLSRKKLSKIYKIAAERIRKETLRGKLGLSEQYWLALQEYRQIVDFRSTNPFRTECTFARWLVSEKVNNPGLYNFWARLFPICYNRTVEESAVMF